MKEPQEEKSSLSYDDRRKILTLKKSVINENKTVEVKEGDKVIEKPRLISVVESIMGVEYTEEGIKLAYKDISEELTFLEERISKLKKQQEELGEMPEDIKELKAKLEKLQTYQKADKMKTEYETMIERLDKLKLEKKQIKDAIGDRLKL